MTNAKKQDLLTCPTLRRITVITGIGLTLLQSCPTAHASVPNCSPVQGKLSSIAGTVEIGHNDKDWQPATLNAPLCGEDSIRVGANSRAAIALVGDTMLRLDQNTTVRLVDLTEKPEQRSVIQLLTGALQSLSRAPRKLAINTPYINGMIEGTEFLTRVGQDRADITVFEGKVIAQNDLGSLPLTHGQSAQALQGQAPQARIVVHPRDAVQWALYYPPIIDFHPETFSGHDGWHAAIKQSVAAYQNGNFQKAFDLIATAPEDINDNPFLAYRASLFLAVGRVEKASADIDRILGANANDANALALQTIIKVVQDQHGQALDIANKSVQVAPKSSAALMALSYAQQAVFNLDGAQKSIEQIIALEPDNALAWARLAELQASFGKLDAALGSANKAATIKPDLSRTQTVLGFSQLMQVNTAAAKDAFNRAIASASSDPLPRLGLGLAKIREGNLTEGRNEIEVAAGLDPNNALVRSYLGKSYYEERRTALTDREYETAKELDGNDPTPYFYDAIQKQTTNRPVDALQDIQKAIELNNNRAVYRSRLLLDSDLAARSASLARVYSDLGYQELALREGWKSVNTDPSNFSAHRFLADSYAVLPRHEIARVSELLQSQLLQPLSMTPIQPRLAESNLFMISAGGPGSLSFNEFNPIFNRDGLTFQTSGLVAENNTYAGEGVLSGIKGKAAFSVGGFHSSSDGFRTNDSHQDDIGNAFVQYEISPKTSLQAEYRYRSIEKGDLLRRFFPDNFSRALNDAEERHTFRLGARHNLSETSTLLGSFIYQDAKFGNHDNVDLGLPDPALFLVNRPESSVSFELQHLFRSQYINVTSGVGHSDINGRIDQLAITPPPSQTTLFSNSTNTDLSHTNAYAYSYITPLKNLKFTLGVSGDFTDGSSRDTAGINQINPKFGISWEPVPGTWLRAAAFRSLKRTLVTNQTLEPTQVAGFNQFYDDLNGTQAWRYGAAIDQKFTKTLFGGVEVSRRDLRIPEIGNINNQDFLTRNDSQENMARSYLLWAPNSWLALRAEYQYEHTDNSAVDPLVKKMDTQRVPLGFSVFLPSGWSTTVTATYTHQHGVFQRLLNTENYQASSSDFWLIDAGLSYRLPKRYGFITVGASNLLDQEFNYLDTDFNNPRVHSGRMVFGKVTLALP